MDETALFYKPQPTATIRTFAKRPGTRQAKNIISIDLCCNADGTHKLPPVVIGKARFPRWLKILIQKILLIIFGIKKVGWHLLFSVSGSRNLMMK